MSSSIKINHDSNSNNADFFPHDSTGQPSCASVAESALPNESQIPTPIMSLKRWVLRRGKRPIVPALGWNNPANLLSFEEARDAYYKADDKRELGIGLIVRPEDGIIFIDLDGCLPHYEKEAHMIVDEFDS